MKQERKERARRLLAERTPGGVSVFIEKSGVLIAGNNGKKLTIADASLYSEAVSLLEEAMSEIEMLRKALPMGMTPDEYAEEGNKRHWE